MLLKAHGLNTNPLSVGITTSRSSFTNVFKFTNITQLPSCLATLKVQTIIVIRLVTCVVYNLIYTTLFDFTSNKIRLDNLLEPTLQRTLKLHINNNITVISF